jgi:hypothetical protein
MLWLSLLCFTRSSSYDPGETWFESETDEPDDFSTPPATVPPTPLPVVGDVEIDPIAHPSIEITGDATIKAASDLPLRLSHVKINAGVHLQAVNLEISTQLTIGQGSSLKAKDSTTNVTFTAKASIVFRATNSASQLGTIDLGRLSDSSVGRNMAPSTILLEVEQDFTAGGTFEPHDLVTGENFLNCDQFWRARVRADKISMKNFVCHAEGAARLLAGKQSLRLEPIINIPNPSATPISPLYGTLLVAGVMAVLVLLVGIIVCYRFCKSDDDEKEKDGVELNDETAPKKDGGEAL